MAEKLDAMRIISGTERLLNPSETVTASGNDEQSYVYLAP